MRGRGELRVMITDLAQVPRTLLPEHGFDPAPCAFGNRRAPTADGPRTDQIALRIRRAERCAGRAILQGEVLLVRITEPRVLADVAVDSVLIFDALNPVTASIAVNVATGDECLSASGARDTLSA